MRSVIQELPGALFLATLTAVVTLILAVLLSVVLGADSRERAEQSRCYAGLTNAMLHEMLDLHGIDASKYPRVSLEDVDCSFLTEPVTP